MWNEMPRPTPLLSPTMGRVSQPTLLAILTRGLAADPWRDNKQGCQRRRCKGATPQGPLELLKAEEQQTTWRG